VGASDKTLLSSLISVVMPLDIYKGQWSKISKIKRSSKLILQIERDLVHLNVMPSHVQVISIPIPDTVVTPAVDAGTSNVRKNPAAHLVDAATPTVTPKYDAPHQHNKYKEGDTSRKPRKCFACQSTTHLYVDCQDPRKAIMAKERMTLLQKRVRAAGKSRDFSRYTPKTQQTLEDATHFVLYEQEGTSQSAEEAHVAGTRSPAISFNLDNISGADISDGDEDEVALGEIDGEYDAIHLVALEQTVLDHEMFGIPDDKTNDVDEDDAQLFGSSRLCWSR
jgi:hypothetical protein